MKEIFLKTWAIRYGLTPHCKILREANGDAEKSYLLLEKHWLSCPWVASKLKEFKSDRSTYAKMFPISKNFAIYEAHDGKRYVYMYKLAARNQKVNFNALKI
jgi:hypothetical protein